jgi:hypothetical protein
MPRGRFGLLCRLDGGRRGTCRRTLVWLLACTAVLPLALSAALRAALANGSSGRLRVVVGAGPCGVGYGLFSVGDLGFSHAVILAGRPAQGSALAGRLAMSTQR